MLRQLNDDDAYSWAATLCTVTQTDLCFGSDKILPPSLSPFTIYPFLFSMGSRAGLSDVASQAVCLSVCL